MNPTTQLTKNVEVLCKEFVASYIPDEVPFFEHVWVAFWDSLECTTIEDLPDHLNWLETDEPVLRLGAIGEQQDQIVDTLYAIGTLCVSAARVLQNDSSKEFDVVRTEAIMREVSAGISSPQHLSNGFDLYVSKLHALLFSEDELGVENANIQAASTTIASSSQVPLGHVVVQGLYDGRHFGPHTMSEEEAIEKSATRPYDFVVDEPNWQVLNHLGEKLFSLSAKSKGRNFLVWLAMTRVGERVMYTDMVNIPGFPKGFNVYEDMNRSIYLIRNILRHETRNRMINSEDRQQLLIQRKGWSYFWIRIHQDIKESRLLD